MELNMMKMIWKIDIDDIELQKPKYGTGSRIDFKKSMSQHSMQTKESDILDAISIANTSKAGALTSIGIYKGQLVAIKNLPKLKGELTRNDLMELKEMRELQHDNINPFIGACLDSASPCALFLYCPKGSLQDVLENDDIRLDMVFKHSLMLDLAEGMYYLHCSAIGSHGRLKSSNCLVDNRWVLRITDYGLNRFLDSVCVEKVEEFQYYKSLLWTAPELLSANRLPRNGTKEGDVYSYGIILHEIFYRMGTFSGLEHMTVKDIIGRVRNREIPPCRPTLFSDVTDLSPAVSKLIQLCWSDGETARPTFGHIRTYIKKNIKGTNKNIVDIILQRLEKYASNLEDLVDQRTMQLMDEKQKTDKLLYRMLPPSCAEQLKAGEMVQPEVFESATVFFSDIVGFTTIAAMSTPIQVIDLLNDLYTCFDDIIAQHDAYKVETIGDAYLVVSGIPQRNGDKHAGEIADMSLHILSALMKFKLQHLPEVKVNVRIGMHTGPCCAGVVGLSMPRYCLFGDTVNTASRMESTGVEQRIHMSEESSIALRRLGGYLTSSRGEIDVKGKGKMRTYWLDGKEGFELALPRLAE